MSEPENKTGILVVGSKLATIAALTELKDTGIIVEHIEEDTFVLDSLSSLAEWHDPRDFWDDAGISGKTIHPNMIILDEFHDISDEVLIMMGKRYGKLKPKRQQSGHRVPKGKMFKSEPGVGPSKAKRIALRKKRKKNK